MKKILLVLLLLLPCATVVFGQDVPFRYMDFDHLWDVKAVYSKNETPGLHIKYLGGQVTYIRNFLFLDGDGVQNPDIGLSLNPSISYATFHSDLNEASSLLIQDGMLNFTPSLYIRILPEARSKFTFFASLTGGVKLYNKFQDIDSSLSSDYISTDDDWGAFDQWVFGIGGGIGFNEVLSLHVNFMRAWHDVTYSTEQYFKKYVYEATGIQSTFIKYVNVRGNFIFKNGSYVFLEWDGYGGSMNNNGIMRTGLGLQLGKKRSSGYKSRVLSTIPAPTQSSPTELDTVTALELKLDQLKLDLQSIKGKSSEKRKMRKDYRALKKKLKKAKTDAEIKQWKKDYDALDKSVNPGKDDKPVTKRKKKSRVEETPEDK